MSAGTNFLLRGVWLHAQKAVEVLHPQFREQTRRLLLPRHFARTEAFVGALLLEFKCASIGIGIAMEEQSSSGSQTYLPGTASLVQEIDSEPGARVTVQYVRVDAALSGEAALESHLPLSLSPERLLVVLRDGRTLIGYLRSVDQFGEPLSRRSLHPLVLSLSLPAANLLMQHTVERIHVGKRFGDIPRGIYLIRGENVALCGEIVSLPLL